MKIRDFKKSDLEKICQFKQESADISFPGVKINLDGFKKVILKSDPERIKVLEDGDKIIGYIWFDIKKTITGRHGVINHLFIDKKYRKSGLGQELVKEAEDWFKSKDIKRARATVTLTNKPSINFCKKLGYKEKRAIMEKEI